MAANGSGPRKLVDSVRVSGPLAWSPDGRRIAAYGGTQPGDWPFTSNIYIVEPNLTRLAEASSPPAWSPDGSIVAFLRGDNRDSLFVVNPDGSGLRKIADPRLYPTMKWNPFPDLSWSPDGSEILLQEYPFIRVKVDGSSYDEGGEPYAVFNGPEDWNSGLCVLVS